MPTHLITIYNTTPLRVIESGADKNPKHGFLFQNILLLQEKLREMDSDENLDLLIALERLEDKILIYKGLKTKPRHRDEPKKDEYWIS